MELGAILVLFYLIWSISFTAEVERQKRVEQNRIDNETWLRDKEAEIKQKQINEWYK